MTYNNDNWHHNVDWNLPDAEIARQAGYTREWIRQVRKQLRKPRPKLFRVRMKSLDRKTKLMKVWKPEMSIKEVARVLDVSYSNACRLLGNYGLKKRRNPQ